MLPRTLLLDLDDTILDDSGPIDHCWREACEAHATGLPGIEPSAVLDAIRATSQWYWSDPERHRAGRLELDAARREVVGLALAGLGVSDTALAANIGDAYSEKRDSRMALLPDAIETIRWFRDSGCRLALLTNGAEATQRRKISRFGLTDLFDAILVEGEMGFGKPDERVYKLALERLDAQPADTWMVGDNLEWDVASPQTLGIFGVWIDVRGQGLPAGSTVRPDRIVRALAELREGSDPEPRPDV